VIYDSEVDTRLHINRVRFLLSKCAINLLERGVKHDASKLEPPEKAAFDLAGDRQLAVTYRQRGIPGFAGRVGTGAGSSLRQQLPSPAALSQRHQWDVAL
jgi:hypothetical protein